MILSVKEHEMHHRGQLMLIERVLGITPHLRSRCRNAWRPFSSNPLRGPYRGCRLQIDPAIWQYELKQNSTGDGVV
jgi:hypothetical protein